MATTVINPTAVTNYFWSPRLSMFFKEVDRPDLEAHYNWPADASPIPDDLYDGFSGTPPAGMVLGTVNFMPAWVTPTPRIINATEFEWIVRSNLERGAQLWGYRSILEALSWAASTTPSRAADAAAILAWRDAVYAWLPAQDPNTTDPQSMPAQPPRP